MILLYIIDDHFLVIEGFFCSFNLESEDFSVVGGSQTITTALKEISRNKPNIIMLDLFIGQSNPVLNFNKIHEAFPTVPIVILTHDDTLLWKIEMFRLGAKAYINKSAEKSDIKQRLQRVAAGETLIPSDIARILISDSDILHLIHHIPDYKEIINGLANGMSIKEIAIKMNQSDSHIEKKLQKIRDCFHVTTNCELVYKASTNQLPLLNI